MLFDIEESVTTRDLLARCESCGTKCHEKTVECDLCGAECCRHCIEEQHGYRVCRNCRD